MYQYMKKNFITRGQPYPGEYLEAVDRIYMGKRPIRSKTLHYTNMIFTGFSWPVYHYLMGGGRFEFKIDGDLHDFDSRKYLDQINVPTLITAGKFDGFSIDIAYGMNSLIPNSKIILFNRSGHWPFVEENDKFIKITENFLSTRT